REVPYYRPHALPRVWTREQSRGWKEDVGPFSPAAPVSAVGLAGASTECPVRLPPRFVTSAATWRASRRRTGRGSRAVGMVPRHLPSAPTAVAALTCQDRRGPSHGFVESQGRLVMRILSAVLSLAVAMALCTNVHAQGARETLVERIQDLDLTDAQETKIAEIRKDFRPRVAKAVKEFATLVKDQLEKMQAVFTPEQKDRLRVMKDERRERRFERL